MTLGEVIFAVDEGRTGLSICDNHLETTAPLTSKEIAQVRDCIAGLIEIIKECKT